MALKVHQNHSLSTSITTALTQPRVSLQELHVYSMCDLRNEHVVRDIIKVSAVLEPRPSRADVICGALLIDFN